ncbi:MAG: Smad nuclear-interacting protein 1, partial [Paramarteilia canceri]
KSKRPKVSENLNLQEKSNPNENNIPIKPAENTKKPSEEIKVEEPNFGRSGKLLEDTNLVNGVVLKYSEPKDSAMPDLNWKLFPFKENKSILQVLYLHRKNHYLIGKDRRVADIPADNPSCSKQHAVIQFRKIHKDDLDPVVVPYLIDLESSNGTYLNHKKIEPKRYYELFEKDIIKFGFSTREYVLMHDQIEDIDSGSDDPINKDDLISD